MIITHIVSKFLNLLYGPFAYLYNFVSWIVSFGHWKEWIFSTIPYIQGNNILELGYGPGYLINNLTNRGYKVYGIDPSWQMTKISRKRLWNNPSLIRGLAEQLPLPTHKIDTVIATFPTEYIFQPIVLNEIKRVLKPNGRLLVLLAAYPRADTPCLAALALLYRITGQTISNRIRLQTSIYSHLQTAGFDASIEWIIGKSADLLLIIA